MENYNITVANIFGIITILFMSWKFSRNDKMKNWKHIGIVTVLLSIFILFISTVSSGHKLHNLISFIGIFAILAIAWLFSNSKDNLNWKAIGWGIGVQLLFAFFIFMVPQGASFFLKINNLAVEILSAASRGTQFLFGALATPPGSDGSLGFILATQALPSIIFFSALVSILYFFKVLPYIIKKFSHFFSKIMKISGAESLSVSSNIFVGVESIITVKPYINKMTISELTTILTAGMATVASNVLALYVFTLKDVFPTIAGHLISASFLSAPAAIVISKIMVPENENPETLGQKAEIHYEQNDNLLDAIISGANNGLKVIAGIAALLVAMLGIVALLDMGLGYFSGMLNNVFSTDFNWSLKNILGYIFYLFTLIIGVPKEDAGLISQIIGERLVLTEVTSYIDLASSIKNSAIVYPRSAVIASYALCGFAHIASMAIFIGGFSALAPDRSKDLSKVAVRALVAATLTTLLTASVAGTFFMNNTLLFK